jgi:hypothetical protein
MANPIPRNKDNTTRLARRAVIYRGLQAQVAAELGLSRVHVSNVCRGLRRSRRVEKALAQAVLRIQRQQKAAA